METPKRVAITFYLTPTLCPLLPQQKWLINNSLVFSHIKAASAHQIDYIMNILRQLNHKLLIVAQYLLHNRIGANVKIIMFIFILHTHLIEKHFKWLKGGLIESTHNHFHGLIKHARGLHRNFILNQLTYNL